MARNERLSGFPSPLSCSFSPPLFLPLGLGFGDGILRACITDSWEMRPFPPSALQAFESIQLVISVILFFCWNSCFPSVCSWRWCRGPWSFWECALQQARRTRASTHTAQAAHAQHQQERSRRPASVCTAGSATKGLGAQVIFVFLCWGSEAHRLGSSRSSASATPSTARRLLDFLPTRLGSSTGQQAQHA